MINGNQINRKIMMNQNSDKTKYRNYGDNYLAKMFTYIRFTEWIDHVDIRNINYNSTHLP